MKKLLSVSVIVLFALGVLLVGCSKKAPETTTPPADTTATATPAPAPAPAAAPADTVTK